MMSVPLWMLILNGAMILIQVGGFAKVIYNDLHHVQESNKRTEDNIKSMSADIITIKTSLASTVTRCEERHSKVVRKRK